MGESDRFPTYLDKSRMPLGDSSWNLLVNLSGVGITQVKRGFISRTTHQPITMQKNKISNMVLMSGTQKSTTQVHILPI